MKKFLKKVAVMLELYGSTLKKEEKLVKDVLKNMDVTDHRRRTINCWDMKFKQLVPVLYKYEEALEFIDYYGYVCEVYFLELQDEDVKNIAFQRSLCRVKKNEYNGAYYYVYGNLLHCFLERWDFDEVVKQELQNDPTKKDVLQLYNRYVLRHPKATLL